MQLPREILLYQTTSLMCIKGSCFDSQKSRTVIQALSVQSWFCNPTDRITSDMWKVQMVCRDIRFGLEQMDGVKKNNLKEQISHTPQRNYSKNHSNVLQKSQHSNHILSNPDIRTTELLIHKEECASVIYQNMDQESKCPANRCT